MTWSRDTSQRPATRRPLGSVHGNQWQWGRRPLQTGAAGLQEERKMKEFPARTNKKEAFYFTVLARLPSCRQSRWLLIGQRIWSSLGWWSIKSPRWVAGPLKLIGNFLALGWNYRRQFKMQCGECNFASSKYWSACSVFQRLLRSCAAREQGGKHASNSPLSSPLKICVYTVVFIGLCSIWRPTNCHIRYWDFLMYLFCSL